MYAMCAGTCINKLLIITIQTQLIQVDPLCEYIIILQEHTKVVLVYSYKES